MSKVVIYVGQNCPYCKKAIDLLNKKNINYDVIDVTNNQEMRLRVVEMSGGRKTVPQIFINEKSIGGFDDMNALDKSGQLDNLLFPQ